MVHTKLLLMPAMLIALCSFPTSSFAVKSGDIVSWQGSGAGQVVFEGKEHAEEGYVCKDCHPALFEMKKGSAKITMGAMNRGKFCGACHNGTVTFRTDDPKKCHECHKQKEKHHKKHSDEHGKD